jgi:hypothetical protein
LLASAFVGRQTLSVACSINVSENLFLPWRVIPSLKDLGGNSRQNQTVTAFPCLWKQGLRADHLLPCVAPGTFNAPWSCSEYLKPIKNKAMMMRQIASTVARILPGFSAGGLSSMAVRLAYKPRERMKSSKLDGAAAGVAGA